MSERSAATCIPQLHSAWPQRLTSCEPSPDEHVHREHTALLYDSDLPRVAYAAVDMFGQSTLRIQRCGTNPNHLSPTLLSCMIMLMPHALLRLLPYMQ